MVIAVFQKIFRSPELKRKIINTFFLIFLFRIGTHIPLFGVNSDAFILDKLSLLTLALDKLSLLTLADDFFSGGALGRLSFLALGTLPIFAAVGILGLTTRILPYLDDLSKKGENGRKKIASIKIYLIAILSIAQSFGLCIKLEHMIIEGIPVVYAPGWLFRFVSVISLTAGSIFILWLSERITDRGIGDGMGIISLTCILAYVSGEVVDLIQFISLGTIEIHSYILVITVLLILVILIILIEQGRRSIPVQYAKRIIGGRIYGGPSGNVNIKLNIAGIDPAIKAASLITFSQMIGNIFNIHWLEIYIDNKYIFYFSFSVLLLFFNYFDTVILFNSEDKTQEMRKNGGYIPGIRPGKRTADYIDRVLTRLTFVGGIYLLIIIMVPMLLSQFLEVPIAFSGLYLIIVISSTIHIIALMEASLLSDHYKGFKKHLKK